MKLCLFNDHRIGIVRGDRVVDVTAAFDDLPRPGWPSPPQDWLIAHFDSRRAAVARLADAAPGVALDSVRLRAPVACPGKIVGAPINYREHIEEANADGQINHGKTYTTLDQYGLFLKANSSLIGPQDRIELPFPDRRTDHEVELGVVIGRTARKVSREQALEHVFGYCVALDITVRGPEFPTFRKSADTFSVLGPWIVTADEIADPGELALELSVNGELRQRSSTRYLIFDVPRLIAYASAMYTLHPGDVIMTGTPAGVGPIVAGDRLHARVQGLGEIDIAVAGAAG